MNKGELVTAVATTMSTKTSDAKALVEAFMGILETELKNGGEVTLPGIGKLKVKTRPARVGRNPATGVSIQIPAKRVVKFSPASEFSAEFSEVPATT
jgi:DNA-binding protein HU-beta